MHIPAGTLHPHRNLSPDPAVGLMVTTARLGRFFADAGRPVTGPPRSRRPPPTWPGSPPRPARYGHTLGTPEENAAVGIQVPKFAGNP